jgi:hypothetical protein
MNNKLKRMLETIMKILFCMSIIQFIVTRLPIIISYFIKFMYQTYIILYISVKYIILYGLILLCIYIIYKINDLIIIVRRVIKNYDKIKDLINSS